MVKRFFSILLVTLMALSLVPVSASTQSTEVDGFESESLTIGTDLVDVTAAGYGGYTSSVWKMDSDEANYINGWTYSGGLAIGDGGNAVKQLSLTPVSENGNTVMKITRDGTQTTGAGVATAYHSFDPGHENDVVYTSFDFKIVTAPGSGGNYIGVRSGEVSTTNLFIFNSNYIQNIAGDGLSGNGSGSEGENWVKHNNEWVRVLIKLTKANATGYLYDLNGNLLIKNTISRDFDLTPGGGGLYSNVRIVLPAQQQFDVRVDNGKIVTVVPGTDTVGFVSDSIADKGSVNPSLKSVDLTFDQPVAVPANGTITLTPNGGEAISCTAASINAGEGLRVSWTATLAPTTQYTLNYAGVTGLAGNALGDATKTLSFTTMDVAILPTTYTDGFESESLAIGTDLVDSTKPLNGGYTSNVWKLDEDGTYRVSLQGFISNGEPLLSMVPVMDGTNKVMKMAQTTNTSIGFGTALYSFTETQADDVVVFSVKFKPVSGSGYIGFANEYYFCKELFHFDSTQIYRTPSDGQKADGFNHENKWYTVKIALSKESVTGSLYDENGELKLVSTNSGTNSCELRNVRFKLDSPQAEVYLDESSMTVIKAGNTVSYSGASSLSTDAWAPAVDLKFDIPVATPAAGAVTCSAGACTVEQIAPDTLRVTLGALAKGTYTLDFSGVKGILNNRLFGATSVTFTAEADEVILAKNKTIDIVIYDWKVSGDQTITVWNYKEAMTPVFYVALYSGKQLVGVEKFTDKALAPGVTDVTMTLSKTYEYVTDIKVIAVNNETDFKPIMDCVDVSQYD